MTDKANSKSQDNTHPRIKELSELLDAVHRLSDTRCSDELYGTFAGIVSRKLGADAIAIFNFNQEINSFSLVYNQGFKTWKDELNSGDGLLSRLRQNRFQPMEAFDDIPEVKSFFREEKPKNLKSVTWALLNMKENVIGLMVLNKSLTEISKNEFYLDFLTRVCMHAAVTINSCLLHERHKKEKEDLDKTLNNLSLLYNIGRAMTYISDLKSLLKYILNQAIVVTVAEKGSIMLHDPDTNQLSVRVLAGLQDKEYEQKVNNNEIKCKTFEPGEGVAGSVFQTGEPVFINKTGEDKRFIESGTSFADSIACIPMKVYDDIIGVINVTNKKIGEGFTGDDIEMLGAVADQAAISISKAQLWEMAINDSLTGLHVRRYFMAKLQDEIHRTQRYKKSLSVIMGDLDQFKSVNDSYGHTAGDKVLKAVGVFLQKSVRDVDSVGRYGGEEFIMFLPETVKEAAFVLADRLRKGILKIEIGNLPPVTISLGIATFPDDGKNIDDLLQRADAALYTAKENGRNQVVSYSEEIPVLENREGVK
ncbi:sensor domain-containing diguanylate cyclase [bacterium]|nr:sensor domain-containing diguanylate cyclase [bacterium]